MSEPRFVPVARAGSIGEKSFRCVEVEATPLVIGRFGDEYFAVEDICSHALASFEKGRLRGWQLTCPLHGATFDIRDGSVTGGPATRPIRSFPVRVRGGMVEVCPDAERKSRNAGGGQ